MSSGASRWLGRFFASMIEGLASMTEGLASVIEGLLLTIDWLYFESFLSSSKGDRHFSSVYVCKCSGFWL